MRRLMTLAVGLCSAALTGGFATAQTAQMACGDHATVTGSLEQQYQEMKMGRGLTSSGHLIEVFAGEAGTWTILLVTPEGVACNLTAGKDWEWTDEAPTSTSSASYANYE